MKQYFGKYRGKVTGNSPDSEGRIRVTVQGLIESDAGGVPAMPCLPYAGAQVGFAIYPPVGANVWVEFEGGDIEKPIWSGCFWGKLEKPVDFKLATDRLIKTDNWFFRFDDANAKFELKEKSLKQSMIFDAQGIAVKNSEASAKLTQSDVKIAFQKSEISLNAQAIKSDVQGSSNIEIQASEIKIKGQSAEGKFASAGIELKNSSAKASIKSSGIKLENSGATVELTSSKVKINKDSLEVS
ncbi:MAG: phage baseplate assembly protein V [bacterium]|nr:phage baseplate assembly protein V [bacterium]